MQIAWVLLMIFVWCFVAAWGIRQDDDRRALRDIQRFLHVANDAFKSLTVAFRQMQEPMQNIAKAFQDLGKAFRPVFQHEGHVVIIQGDMTEFDPSVFRGARSWRTAHIGDVVKLNPEEEIL